MFLVLTDHLALNMSLPCDLTAFCCTLTLWVMIYAVVISMVHLVIQFIFRCIHIVMESN